MSGSDNEEGILAQFAAAQRKLEGAQSARDCGFYEDAVSRSYYAAFHAVTAALASKGLSYSSHGQTIGAFNKEFVHTGRLPKEAYFKLQRLFEDRHIGDYSATRTMDGAIADRDIGDAKWLLEHCRALLEP